jgi:hypothetical protein
MVLCFRGFRFVVLLFWAIVGAMVVDEFEFCADTTSPALANAVIATIASPRTKRQMVLFLTCVSPLLVIGTVAQPSMRAIARSSMKETARQRSGQ